ncbi:MAG: hypothetical protein IJ444_05095, partial [Kiritimatiellae bacterium]|nr:hypothetical protein [Kiritimatiellia bacterium]
SVTVARGEELESGEWRSGGEVCEFDSLRVGEFDSFTVKMRVAEPPGVAGARGGKVPNLCLLSLSIPHLACNLQKNQPKLPFFDLNDFFYCVL